MKNFSIKKYFKVIEGNINAWKIRLDAFSIIKHNFYDKHNYYFIFYNLNGTSDFWKYFILYKENT